jgi:hypothetical protein
MATIEAIAEAALQEDSLQARSLTQDLWREKPDLSRYGRPQTNDVRLLALTAGLLELFAQRLHQNPPDWTREVGPAPEPVWLVSAAKTMKRLRRLCETEAPEPLRKRGLYAPPNFLEMV